MSSVTSAWAFFGEIDPGFFRKKFRRWRFRALDSALVAVRPHHSDAVAPSNTHPAIAMKSTSRSHLLVLSLLLSAVAITPSIARESAAPADRRAEVVSTVAPTIPYLARRATAAAEITVAFTVTTEGKVTDAKVVEQSNPDFIKPALEAVRQWTFRPATKNGQAVASRLEQTFTFNVHDQVEAERTAQIAAKKRQR